MTEEMRKKHRWHCCASCTYYVAIRTTTGVKTSCGRLGYDTEPSWAFECWVPNARVAKKLEEIKRSITRME